MSIPEDLVVPLLESSLKKYTFVCKERSIRMFVATLFIVIMFLKLPKSPLEGNVYKAHICVFKGIIK